MLTLYEIGSGRSVFTSSNGVTCIQTYKLILLHLSIMILATVILALSLMSAVPFVSGIYYCGSLSPRLYYRTTCGLEDRVFARSACVPETLQGEFRLSAKGPSQ
jgi:hypothetical protein